MSRRRPILVYLPGAKILAEKVVKILGIGWKAIPAEVKYFDDGELKCLLPKGEDNSVRGADTYLAQVPFFGSKRSPQDLFMELVAGLATLTECGATFRTAVIPWYYYACQDKKRQRECLSARLAADFISTAGATHVITIDIHNNATEGFFDRRVCTFNGLFATNLMLRYFNETLGILDGKDRFAVSAVDTGGSSRVIHIAKQTGIMPVLPTKVKDYKTLKPKSIIINENVRGKIVIIFDDMVRSGGSIAETAKALKAKGAKKIYISATHPDFCGQAIEILDELKKNGIIEKAVLTDSFCFPGDFGKNHPWFVQISLDDMLARTIASLHAENPVSNIYLDDDRSI